MISVYKLQMNTHLWTHIKNQIFKKYTRETSQEQKLTLYKSKSCESDQKQSYHIICSHGCAVWFFLLFPAKYFLTGMLGMSERDGLYLSRRHQTKVLCKQRKQTGLKTSAWNGHRGGKERNRCCAGGEDGGMRTRKNWGRECGKNLMTDRQKRYCSEVSLSKLRRRNGDFSYSILTFLRRNKNR